MPSTTPSVAEGQPESFQVQVFGARWGGFTAYVPHLDLEVQGDTFDEAERRAVEAARSAHREERP